VSNNQYSSQSRAYPSEASVYHSFKKDSTSNKYSYNPVFKIIKKSVENLYCIALTAKDEASKPVFFLFSCGHFSTGYLQD
jgi:hypothetical protein